MKNTWGYQLWWVEVRNKASSICRRGCERSCKDGKRSYFLKWVGKSLSNLSSKPFWRTPWAVLNFPKV